MSLKNGRLQHKPDIKLQKGLSLIELLIVLVIISVLFAVGFLNYRDYARRQSVISAARQLESDVRLARQMAFEGRKPEDLGCDDNSFLSGYIFEDNNDNTYNILARCDDNTDYTIKGNVELPYGITMTSSPNNPIMFKSVGSGVVILTSPPIPNDSITVTLTQEATGYEAELIIGTSVRTTYP